MKAIQQETARFRIYQGCDIANQEYVYIWLVIQFWPPIHVVVWTWKAEKHESFFLMFFASFYLYRDQWINLSIYQP